MSRRRFQRKSGIVEWLDMADLAVDPGHLEAVVDVPVSVGKAGDLLAEYVERLALSEGEFETWKSRRTESLTAANQEPGEGKGLPEWKAKALLAAAPEFVQHSVRIGNLRAAIEYLKAYHSAVRARLQVADFLLNLRKQDFAEAGEFSVPGRIPGSRQTQSGAERFREARESRSKE